MAWLDLLRFGLEELVKILVRLGHDSVKSDTISSSSGKKGEEVWYMVLEKVR